MYQIRIETIVKQLIKLFDGSEDSRCISIGRYVVRRAPFPIMHTDVFSIYQRKPDKLVMEIKVGIVKARIISYGKCGGIDIIMPSTVRLTDTLEKLEDNQNGYKTLEDLSKSFQESATFSEKMED